MFEPAAVRVQLTDGPVAKPSAVERFVQPVAQWFQYFEEQFMIQAAKTVRLVAGQKRAPVNTRKKGTVALNNSIMLNHGGKGGLVKCQPSHVALKQ